MLEDFVVILSAVISAFFLVMSLILIARYRTLAISMNESTRLARNLWEALELRLKRQDERIVDLMARMELYGARSSRQSSLETGRDSSIFMAPTVSREPETIVEGFVESIEKGVSRSSGNQRDIARSTGSVLVVGTELNVLKALLEGSKTSIEINRLLGTTREHAARLMKDLFDSGMVVRNEQKKPYVYQITDAGISQVRTKSDDKKA